MDTPAAERLAGMQYALIAAATADDSEGLHTLVGDLSPDDARAMLCAAAYSYSQLLAAAAGVDRDGLLQHIRQRMLDKASE